MKFSISRYDPDHDERPYLQDFDIVLADSDRMLLDVLRARRYVIRRQLQFQCACQMPEPEEDAQQQREHHRHDRQRCVGQQLFGEGWPDFHSVTKMTVSAAMKKRRECQYFEHRSEQPTRSLAKAPSWGAIRGALRAPHRCGEHRQQSWAHGFLHVRHGERNNARLHRWW